MTAHGRDACMLARSIVDDVVAERWGDVESTFGSQLRSGLTSEDLAAAWSRVNDLHGRVTGIGDSTVIQHGELHVVDTDIELGSSKLCIRLSLSSDSLLAGIYFLPRS